MIDENQFPKGWYALFASNEIKKCNHPYKTMRFGLKLVVWRNNNGKVRVMQDKCPHRSAALSLGKIVDDKIICPFHGFNFDGTDGHCSYAPEFNAPIPKLKVNNFIVHEDIGIIWVFWGNEVGTINLSEITNIHNNFDGKYTQITKIWHSNITRCIENQLDYTHLPVVHKSTIGRNFKMPLHPRIVDTDNSILSFFSDVGNEPASEYYFPNIWVLNISKKAKLVVFFVPISVKETKFYLRTYNNLIAHKAMRFILSPIINAVNRIILKQDQRVVESQGITPSYREDNELLMRNDTAIRKFRQLWQDNI